MARLYLKRDLPPCPDPDIYIIFRFGDKWGWKKKRGTDKKVVLNESFERNKNNTAITSPAAKEITNKLAEFLKDTGKERPIATIGGRLKKHLNRTGILDYTGLFGFEFQKEFDLGSMFKAGFKLKEINGQVTFSSRISKWQVKAPNTIATEFFVEIILLYGEMLSNQGLRIETDASGLMPFNNDHDTEVVLSLLLPESMPWMLLLRMSCMEGREVGKHPKLHRARVIATGRGRSVEEGKREL